MLVAGEPPLAGEFQKADVSPYETRGDGRLDATDFQLVKNYVAVLVQPQTAGGPTGPVLAAAESGEVFERGFGGRVVRIGPTYASGGRQGCR